MVMSVMRVNRGKEMIIDGTNTANDIILRVVKKSSLSNTL